MMSPFLGEFIGTLLLVLLGDGVVANVLLNKSKGQSSGWMVIASGWAFAVMVGVFAAITFGSPDAHLNPAVTVWDAIVSGKTAKLAVYLPAQFLGAFIGATLVWLQYLPHWKETTDAGLKLACFSTGPAIRNVPANLISELIGTAVLLIGVGAIFSPAVTGKGLAGGLPPFLVGAVVWGIGLSLGGTTGYAINPARDLAPRIAHAILPIAGKGPSDWGYSWIPVVGPFLGAVVAGVLFKIVF
ncbi:MAG: MIP/aquaporin family protein [Chthoniobacter sp.]|uniref:MIP/aquaporin family protein n=1 Tax=Chthoniobacter sp. TaxID=2510640 RepID=UPI0032A29665